jgi:hypothetical protein
MSYIFVEDMNEPGRYRKEWIDPTKKVRRAGFWIYRDMERYSWPWLPQQQAAYRRGEERDAVRVIQGRQP